MRFTTTEPVSVDDVIESLKGMDRLVRHHLPKALTNLTGAKVKRAELLVSGVEDGSLITDTLVNLVFGSRQEYDKFINGIREDLIVRTDDGKILVKGQAVGALVAALAVAGLAWWAWPSSPSSPLLHVSGSGSTVIVIGAESYGKSPEDFARVIDSSVGAQQRKSAARAGAQFFAPTRGQSNAGVEVFNEHQQPVPVVAASVINQLPRDIQQPDQSEDRSLQNVRVYLRASDGDSDTRGWAGTIERVVEQRTRVVFANPSDASRAMYRPSIDADVTVTYADAAHTRAKLIIVERVH